MISRAVVYVDDEDEPRISICSETGLVNPELDDPEMPGADIDLIRVSLEAAFREFFPEQSIEVRFPELGECS